MNIFATQLNAVRSQYETRRILDLIQIVDVIKVFVRSFLSIAGACVAERNDIDRVGNCRWEVQGLKLSPPRRKNREFIIWKKKTEPDIFLILTIARRSYTFTASLQHHNLDIRIVDARRPTLATVGVAASVSGAMGSIHWASINGVQPARFMQPRLEGGQDKTTVEGSTAFYSI